MRRDTGETVSQYTHTTQEQVDEYKLAYKDSKIWRLIIRPSDMPILSQYKGPKNFGWLPFAPMVNKDCLLYTSPSPRDRQKSRMPSSA